MFDNDWPAEPYIPNWYVVVKSGRLQGLLAGPYGTAQAALADMNNCVAIAQTWDSYAVLYDFSVCLVPPHVTRLGKLNDEIAELKRKREIYPAKSPRSRSRRNSAPQQQPTRAKQKSSPHTSTDSHPPRL